MALLLFKEQCAAILCTIVFEISFQGRLEMTFSIFGHKCWYTRIEHNFINERRKIQTKYDMIRENMTCDDTFEC